MQVLAQSPWEVISNCKSNICLTLLFSSCSKMFFRNNSLIFIISKIRNVLEPYRHTIKTPPITHTIHLPDTSQRPPRQLPNTFYTSARHFPDTFQAPQDDFHTPKRLLFTKYIIIQLCDPKLKNSSQFELHVGPEYGNYSCSTFRENLFFWISRYQGRLFLFSKGYLSPNEDDLKMKITSK